APARSPPGPAGARRSAALTCGVPAHRVLVALARGAAWRRGTARGRRPGAAPASLPTAPGALGPAPGALGRRSPLAVGPALAAVTPIVLRPGNAGAHACPHPCLAPLAAEQPDFRLLEDLELGVVFIDPELIERGVLGLLDRPARRDDPFHRRYCPGLGRRPLGAGPRPGGRATRIGLEVRGGGEPLPPSSAGVPVASIAASISASVAAICSSTDGGAGGASAAASSRAGSGPRSGRGAGGL